MALSFVLVGSGVFAQTPTPSLTPTPWYTRDVVDIGDRELEESGVGWTAVLEYDDYSSCNAGCFRVRVRNNLSTPVWWFELLVESSGTSSYCTPWLIGLCQPYDWVDASANASPCYMAFYNTYALLSPIQPGDSCEITYCVPCGMGCLGGQWCEEGQDWRMVSIRTDGSPPTPTPWPDTDGDRLTDDREGWPPAPHQPNRYLFDSDGDGYQDGFEDDNRNGSFDPGTQETDATNPDTDRDGLSDGIEVYVVPSNPLNAQSPPSYVDEDGDRIPATDDANDHGADADGDRFNDGYEISHFYEYYTAGSNRFPQLGDLNGDQSVSNLDALLAQTLFLNLAGPDAPIFGGTGEYMRRGFKNSDANLDGQISNLDALILQSFFVTGVTELPAGS